MANSKEVVVTGVSTKAPWLAPLWNSDLHFARGIVFEIALLQECFLVEAWRPSSLGRDQMASGSGTPLGGTGDD
jgi:hypothetical protein